MALGSPSPSEYWMMMALVGGFSSLAMLIVEIAFVVVIATVVRRERPDAWLLFAGSVACDLVALLVTTVGNVAMGALLTQGGSLYALAGVNLLGSILRLVGRALVILGVARLARQPAVAAPWP